MEQIIPNQRDCQVALARTLANKSWILRQAMGTKSLAESAVNEIPLAQSLDELHEKFIPFLVAGVAWFDSARLSAVGSVFDNHGFSACLAQRTRVLAELLWAAERTYSSFGGKDFFNEKIIIDALASLRAEWGWYFPTYEKQAQYLATVTISYLLKTHPEHTGREYFSQDLSQNTKRWVALIQNSNCTSQRTLCRVLLDYCYTSSHWLQCGTKERDELAEFITIAHNTNAAAELQKIKSMAQAAFE